MEGLLEREGETMMPSEGSQNDDALKFTLL
jgi:hypothetical protein